MTTSTRHLINTIQVTTRHDLVRFWSALLGDEGFGRRTLWLVILDDDGRPAPAVMPIDDLPEVPSVAAVDAFRQLLDHLARCGTPVLLLSRPGPCRVQEDDLRWGRALGACAPRWPVHLATEDAYGRCVVSPLPGPEEEAGPAPEG
jgi:hypothetical protein